jgi:hypothetical protein
VVGCGYGILGFDWACVRVRLRAKPARVRELSMSWQNKKVGKLAMEIMSFLADLGQEPSTNLKPGLPFVRHRYCRGARTVPTGRSCGG